LRLARTYVALFWLLWLLIAVAFSRGPPGSSAFAIAAGLGSVAMPILCYLWCKADSSARGVKPPPGAIPLMVLLLPIGWAYYVLATRPLFRAALVVLGTVLGALVILGLAQALLESTAHVAT
jgi:hypothetical protein